ERLPYWALKITAARMASTATNTRIETMVAPMATGAATAASAPGLTLTLRGRRNPKSDAAIPNSATIHSGNHGTSRAAVPAITTVEKNATSSASTRIEK